MIYKYFLEIISIGAAPYDNRVQWLEETRKVGTVIRMVLNPIAEIFHDNIRDYDYGLNPGLFQILWVLFYELAENYCQIMFGKIFYRSDSYINFPHSDEECKACTTKADGSICHFPFYWNNNRYSSCIQQKHSDPWCPTEVRIMYRITQCSDSIFKLKSDNEAVPKSMKICGDHCPLPPKN